jgi:hypothetical protein
MNSPAGKFSEFTFGKLVVQAVLAAFLSPLQGKYRDFILCIY